MEILNELNYFICHFFKRTNIITRHYDLIKNTLKTKIHILIKFPQNNLSKKFDNFANIFKY